jgi:hypothetical protein
METYSASWMWAARSCNILGYTSTISKSDSGAIARIKPHGKVMRCDFTLLPCEGIKRRYHHMIALSH